MGFFTRLEKRAREVDSLLCIGLDPHPGDLPEDSAAGALISCLKLVEATQGLAAAYKPNIAFFEAYGAEGISALQQVMRAIPSDTPVILDAKRGDIGSTSEAYARAAFQALGASAVTLSPYLGYDSIAPFLADPERGGFLLCKTSNPGAGEIQDLLVFAHASTQPNSLSMSLSSSPFRPLFEEIALLAQLWNKRDNLGLVVGATYPEALRRVRTIAPGLWILSPGVGAQGGNLDAALQAGLRADGLGLLIATSRSVSRAADPRQAAESLRQQINARRPPQVQAFPDPWPPLLERIACSLLDAGCVRFGEFTLKSGVKSPIYIDLRELASNPGLLQMVAAAYRAILVELDYDRLAAIPYAGLPIATAISLQNGKPMIYPRKEIKDYGTQAAIEGSFSAGEKVVVIDDLATTGGSKFEVIEKLAAADLRVTDVVVLIDRQSGAKEALAERGFRLHTVFTLRALLDYWQAAAQISSEQANTVRAFLSAAAGG